MRISLSRIVGWRLNRGGYRFPIAQKSFDINVKATGQNQPRSSKLHVLAVDV